MIKNNYKSLIFFLAITFSASFIGNLITKFNKEPWYSELKKTPLTPPGWVFGTIWPLLYFLMALAIWIAVTTNSKYKNRIIILYFIQLIINASWTPVFFGMHSIIGGLLLIPLLIICIALLMKEYYIQSRISFYLMIPYFVWCCFAFFLNLRIYQLN